MKLPNKYVLFGIISAILIATIVGAWCVFRNQKTTQSVQDKISSLEQSNSQRSTSQSEIESVKDLIDGEYTFAPVDTSTWQTYRDEELGFEVKIPEDWSGKADGEGVCLQEKERKYFVEETSVCPIRISFSDRENLQASRFHDILSRRIKTPENKVWHTRVDGYDTIVSYGFGNVLAYIFYGNKYYLVSSELDGTFESGENFYPSELATLYPWILTRMAFLK
ncbi:MAG: hypothetical protein IPJ67_03415 [Candidatus Moraniibacteriota bacterium]|nr:MAG: hypothetical protein IPJ67_03415 [Candidatus Moranbacteria bacterium]